MIIVQVCVSVIEKRMELLRCSKFVKVENVEEEYYEVRKACI